uniref:Expressed protein n=1 Tax=Echinococcus granulosus TaxID=6210 RepID=A0A068WEP4_ECHGR|nr:expressed protein [Echinococcus granulosus]
MTPFDTSFFLVAFFLKSFTLRHRGAIDPNLAAVAFPVSLFACVLHHCQRLSSLTHICILFYPSSYLHS